MASISRDPNGRRRILFMAADGKRKTIRLGKVSQRTADAIKTRVEHLVSASIGSSAWDDETARWVADLGDDLADKLAAVELIPKRESAKLGKFLESYITGRNIRKENTLRNYNRTRENLIDYFGEKQNLREISPGDCDEWRQSLLAKHSEATVSREVKRARQYFRAAVRKKLIRENPFADLPAPQQVNSEREFFVTGETTGKVIDACPDGEWRLIVALARYGGLRCPSELLRLRWIDIDWELERMTVHSPKTEHHPGGASRQVPIFPELRPYLEEVFDNAEPGTEYVITRYRQRNANLRTQLLRIIGRAGVQPWPKLFQNMRASRETELSEDYPMHVICAWIGNSERIAAKHYLQVTDEHFERAAKGGAESGAPAAQKQAQHATAPSGTDSQEQKKTPDNPGVVLHHAMPCDTVQSYIVPPRGVEPLSSD